MSIFCITDDQIRAFAADATSARAWISRALNRDKCYLADYWDGLHFLLTGSADASDLPLAALKRGDVTLPKIGEPTHAIFSATAQRFATELLALTAEDLRAHFDLGKLREAKVYPMRPWFFAGGADGIFSEMMFYFARLRTVAQQAVDDDAGLLFHRYEDW